MLSEIVGLRDNEWAVEPLELQLQSTLGLVPFVGAGVSRPHGFPLWSEFWLTQAKLAGIEQAIAERLAKAEYEEAAENLLASRGTRRFHDAIASAAGSLRLLRRHGFAPGFERDLD